MCCICRFGIVPSWGLSQKLSRIIGPNKAREVSLTAMPFTAEEAQKLGFVNYVVEGTELLKKAREIARLIAHNNHDIVIRYKSIINDGFKLDLHQALALEKVYFHCQAIVYFWGKDINLRNRICYNINKNKLHQQ